MASPSPTSEAGSSTTADGAALAPDGSTAAHADDGVAARRSRWTTGYTVALLRTLTVVLVLVAWQLVSGRLVPAYAISDPVSVARALVDLLSSASGWADIQTTGTEILAGFVLGVVVGSVAALVLGAIPLASRVLEPLIAALNGIPKIALAPLFLLFFGIGESSKIAIAMWGVAFVMFFNLYFGLRLVDGKLVETVRVMAGRRSDVLRWVTIPSLAAPFFAGLKASAPLAVLGVIAGEFIASFNGVGHLLFTYSNNLDAAGTFASLVVLVIMSLIINAVLTWLDGLVLRHLGLGPGGARGGTASR